MGVGHIGGWVQLRFLARYPTAFVGQGGALVVLDLDAFLLPQVAALPPPPTNHLNRPLLVTGFMLVVSTIRSAFWTSPIPFIPNCSETASFGAADHQIRGLSASGDLLFLAQGDNSSTGAFRIIDTSDPANPSRTQCHHRKYARC